MNKTLFVINPISGRKSKEALPAIIEHYFDKETYKIVWTDKPGHAPTLVKNGIEDGFTHFIAVGGDGTVNEVAKTLVGTNFAMGIIPFGSGNGLARHNKINMDLRRALIIAKEAKIKCIDTCQLNGVPFINMAGVGFDAHIGELFAKSKGRGFQTYIKTTINEFRNYVPKSYKVFADGKEISLDAFLISFANSSQYGNNAFIAPKADIADGLIDVCILKPFPKWKIAEIAYRLFAKNIDESEYVKTFKAKSIVVERAKEGVLHVDGEPFLSNKRLEVSILPKSLNLIVHESLADKITKSSMDFEMA